MYSQQQGRLKIYGKLDFQVQISTTLKNYIIYHKNCQKNSSGFLYHKSDEMDD